MKVTALIARLLLGILFVFFGSNGLFHFLKTPPMPPGPAAEFAGVMMASHYMTVVALLQVVGGALVLTRFVPLGLTVLGPILVNILLFHLLLEPKGLSIGLLATLLWLLSAWRVRAAFAGLFTSGLDPARLA